MPFTSSAFDRRLAAFERAEQGRFGRPLGDDSLARVALARRIARAVSPAVADPATVSRGSGFLLQR
ncbi:hypothetical protein GCM10022281_06150 [Sphingomonas rosea]|uniref:Uncharacterized protein n=1 Tax=Sphingomonas rosea TaxID=335605 RepID=A0ABP7TQL9_9SPHN